MKKVIIIIIVILMAIAISLGIGLCINKVMTEKYIEKGTEVFGNDECSDCTQKSMSPAAVMPSTYILKCSICEKNFLYYDIEAGPTLCSSCAKRTKRCRWCGLRQAENSECKWCISDD